MADENTYSIDITNQGEFLHAKVSGSKLTPEIALAYWRKIISECESQNCSKILLEHNFAEMIGMREMLTIIGPVGELLKGRMFAFYDRFGHYDIPEAGKVILRSKEVKMQIFHDLKEAERWLRAN